MPALRLALVSIALAMSCHCLRADTGPVSVDGRWLIFDDDTGQKRAIVEIVREGKRATGRIVEFFPKAGEEADPVCEDCPDGDRGRKIRGLAILQLDEEADDNRGRGTVLDPEEGRRYRCVATITKGGKALNLRGYYGLELFGRSQTWVRAD